MENNNIIDTEKNITESQIKLILSDWLGNLRQGENGDFVHKGKGGIRSSEESITDYLMGDVGKFGNNKELLMKKTLQASRNLVDTITPEKVNVITGGSKSYQGVEDNGREIICLATNFFDDSRLSNREKCGIMLGLACHEAAHSAYTEQEPKMKLINRYPSSQQKLVKRIWNTIEDERIEYLLTDKSPGLSSLIAETKRHYFKSYENKVKTTVGEPTEPLPRLLNTLLQAVRYPSELTEEKVTENFDVLDSIRKVLTPYPLTPEGACRKTDEIMSLIKDMIKQDMQDKQNQQQQEGKGQNQGQSSEESNGKNSGQDQNQGGNPSNGRSQPTKQDIEKALEQALKSKQAEGIMKALEEDDRKGLDDRNGTNASSEIKHDTKKQRFINEDSAEKVGGSGAGGGFNPNTYVFKPKGDPAVYGAVASSIRKYVPAMSKTLSCKSREREFILCGLKSGKLDMNKLVSLQAGNTNIFTKKGMSRCSTASICVLIDESGSMYGEKQEAARQTAILLNEAIKHIKTVNYYCYGYSGYLNVYCEAGKSHPWSLSDVEATGGTPTGEAMQYAAERIRRRTNEPVLMLVITDGSADNTEKVIRMDNELRRNGFTVIGIGVQTSYVRNSFKESLTFNDISELPVKLGTITRKYLSNTLVKSKEML